MKDKIVILIKGFVMGIANIIPGVSGGTLALTLGIYENLIHSITHFFSDLKSNLKFLIPLAIGLGLSVVSMSSVISKSFEVFPIPTIMFFMGLVIGGLPLLFNKVKNTDELHDVSSYVIMLITFLIVMLLLFSDKIFGSGLGDVNLANMNIWGYIILLIVGMVAAATMVIPGVSGSLVLMLLGYYFPVLNTIKDLTKFQNIGNNILILAFFGVGVLVGIILIAKLIEFLLKKYEIKTYFGVIGFILASIIAIPISVNNEIGGIVFTIPSFLVGILLLIVGLVVGYKLGEK